MASSKSAATTSGRINGSLISRRTGISIGVLFLLLLPLISACVFIAVANERIKTLTDEVQILRATVTEHQKLGVDGIPHPKGLKTKVDTIERELYRRTRGHWTVADDKHFMEKFARENDLKLPKHEPIVPPE